jgi:hypothetical protein
MVTFKIFSSGKVRSGKWSVRDGVLCPDDGTPDLGCKEVWLSGNKVQFRSPGSSLVIEGIPQNSNRGDRRQVNESAKFLKYRMVPGIELAISRRQANTALNDTG